MGEIADAMLEGDLCAGCGCFIDAEGGEGFPRYCSASCGPSGADFTPNPNGKREKRRRRMQRQREKRLDTLAGADTKGWEKKSPFHFQRKVGDKIVNWWPSTGAWCVGNTQEKPTYTLEEYLKKHLGEKQ